MHFDQVARNLVHGGQVWEASRGFLPRPKVPQTRRGTTAAPATGGDVSDDGATGAGLRRRSPIAAGAISMI